MQSRFKVVFVAAVVASGIGAALMAAAPAASVIGTWKLDAAKSTFSSGPAPKSQIRSYAESAQGIVLTLTTTAADGKESTITLTFKEDGKPHAVSGNFEFDTISVKRLDALTVQSIEMKAGTTIGTGVRTLSKDGKSLVFIQKGTHSNGAKYDDRLVYDRQ